MKQTILLTAIILASFYSLNVKAEETAEQCELRALDAVAALLFVHSVNDSVSCVKSRGTFTMRVTQECTTPFASAGAKKSIRVRILRSKAFGGVICIVDDGEIGSCPGELLPGQLVWETIELLPKGEGSKAKKLITTLCQSLP